MNHRKRTSILLLATAALGLASTALAGRDNGSEVEFGPSANPLYPNATIASGSFNAVHDSPDSTQFIGCSTTAYSSGTPQALCYARDASGAFKYCITGNDADLLVIEGIDETSNLLFEIGDSGECSSISVLHSSSRL